jgi:hypothetical protein
MNTRFNLLERIISFRTRVGDGLNDEEVTRLLLQQALPPEAGFAFVSLCEGCATFSVPPQDPENWYPEKGWVAPEKEAVARSIAAICGYALYEPPDTSSTFRASESSSTLVHHHLELTSQSESIVIAHPNYLKIRLFAYGAKRPLPLRPDLMQLLTGLYQT